MNKRDWLVMALLTLGGGVAGGAGGIAIWEINQGGGPVTDGSASTTIAIPGDRILKMNCEIAHTMNQLDHLYCDGTFSK
jgi:hypothetical protein